MKKLLTILFALALGVSSMAQTHYPYIMHNGKVVTYATPVECSNSNYGDESVTTPNDDVYTNWITYIGPFTVDAGEVQSIEYYIGGTASATSMYVAIYDDDSNSPGSLITNGTSNEVTSISTSTWHTFTFGTNPDVVDGDYWICCMRNGSNQEWYYGGTTVYDYYDENDTGSFPSTATPSSIRTNTIDPSMYFVICN